MAKYEGTLRGDFSEMLRAIETGVLQGSVSASLEDSSDYQTGAVRCAVRVFERYSMLGKNRVSLSVTLVGNGDEAFLSAIASGGSQAVFLKINTFGEQAFLDQVVRIADAYRAG